MLFHFVAVTPSEDDAEIGVYFREGEQFTTTNNSYKQAVQDIFLTGEYGEYVAIGTKVDSLTQVWTSLGGDVVRCNPKSVVFVLRIEEEKSSKFVRAMKATGHGLKVAGLKVIKTDLGDIGRGTKKVSVATKDAVVYASKVSANAVVHTPTVVKSKMADRRERKSERLNDKALGALNLQ